jgi:hypothetical protein
MHNHIFKPFTDAISAGYVIARGKYGTYHACPIYSRDTRGGSAIAYSYRLTAAIAAEIDGNMTFDVQAAGDFGNSVAVWINDKNKIQQTGSCCVMYSTDVLAAAIKKSLAWIDVYFEANLNGAARAVRNKADRAATDARHTAKWIGRQIRRNARQATAML